MSRKKKAVNGASNIVIREMEFADLHEVFTLGTKLFTAEKWPTLYRAWDEYEIVNLFGSDGEYCLVAEHDKKVVGFALGSLMRKPRSPWSYGWLKWLGISPAHKGRGIGKRLMNRLTELFIDNGARMMLVDTDAENHDALALFRKMEFTDEMKHIYLSKNLSSHPKYVERIGDEEGWDDEEG